MGKLNKCLAHIREGLKYQLEEGNLSEEQQSSLLFNFEILKDKSTQNFIIEDLAILADPISDFSETAPPYENFTISFNVPNDELSPHRVLFINYIPDEKLTASQMFFLAKDNIWAGSMVLFGFDYQVGQWRSLRLSDPVDEFDKKTLEQLDEQNSGAIGLIHSFCELLQCKNVTTEKEEISGLKRMLHKKKKTPLYEFRVLKIDGKPVLEGTGNSRPHGSPRMHWRRAHIRRLPGGGTTMVRQCLVGKKGFIEKEYKVAI